MALDVKSSMTRFFLLDTLGVTIDFLEYMLKYHTMIKLIIRLKSNSIILFDFIES